MYYPSRFKNPKDQNIQRIGLAWNFECPEDYISRLATDPYIQQQDGATHSTDDQHASTSQTISTGDATTTTLTVITGIKDSKSQSETPCKNAQAPEEQIPEEEEVHEGDSDFLDLENQTRGKIQEHIQNYIVVELDKFRDELIKAMAAEVKFEVETAFTEKIESYSCVHS